MPERIKILGCAANSNSIVDRERAPGLSYSAHSSAEVNPAAIYSHWTQASRMKLHSFSRRSREPAAL
jgi:hypothetical protein